MKDKYLKRKVGDWIYFCDFCGMKCWASETTLLDTYTGRGGMRVCPDDVDKIDMGLVPYKCPPEQSIPFSHDTIHTNDPQYFIGKEIPPFNAAEFDPLGTNPNTIAASAATWDQQKYLSWNNWLIIWNNSGNN